MQYNRATTINFLVFNYHAKFIVIKLEINRVTIRLLIDEKIHTLMHIYKIDFGSYLLLLMLKVTHSKKEMIMYVITCYTSSS